VVPCVDQRAHIRCLSYDPSFPIHRSYVAIHIPPYFTGPTPKLLPQYQPNHTGTQLYSTLDRFITSNYEPWQPILTSHSCIVWRPYRNSIPLHLIPTFLLLLLLSSQLYLRSFLLKRSRFSSPFQTSEPIATNCNQPDYNASE